MYYYLYKITNLLNSKIYIGVHKTTNLDDGYMGSGIKLKKSIKKYGIDNFKKEILEYFKNEQDMYLKESVIVNWDFVGRNDTYNIALGGICGSRTNGQVTVRDKENNTFNTDIDDPRYLSGELVGVNKGKVIIKDGFKKYCVSFNDPRYLSGELISIKKGKLTAKDKYNNFYHINVDDPRYLSGEFVHVSKGNTISEEHKRKIGDANSKKQKGNKNSQFGTCWIYKDTTNKKIKKEELPKYIENGWFKGRNV